MNIFQNHCKISILGHPLSNHDGDCADIDAVYLHARLDALVVSAADAVPRLLRHHTVVAARPASDQKKYGLKDFILTFIPQRAFNFFSLGATSEESPTRVTAMA